MSFIGMALILRAPLSSRVEFPLPNSIPRPLTHWDSTFPPRTVRPGTDSPRPSCTSVPMRPRPRDIALPPPSADLDDPPPPPADCAAATDSKSRARERNVRRRNSRGRSGRGSGRSGPGRSPDRCPAPGRGLGGRGKDRGANLKSAKIEGPMEELRTGKMDQNSSKLMI